MIYRLGHKIATNWNNAAGLAYIEDAIVWYQDKPLIIQSRGRWDEGIERERADKLSTITGFQTFDWFAPVMGANQYDNLQDTYTTGGTGLRGKVTARTRSMNDDDTFANYSAVLVIPKRKDLERKFDAYLNVKLRFIVEAAL